MSDTILVVTEDFNRSFAIARAASALCRAQLATLQSVPERHLDAQLVIVDANLEDVDTITAIKAEVTKPYDGVKKLFVADTDSRRQVVQANALGADRLIPRDADMSEIQDRIRPFLAESAQLDAAPVTESGQVAIEKIETLNSSIYDAVKSAEALPMNAVGACTDTVIESLRENDVSSWLAAVRRHHSYTYRHSMHVTGLAVAFGLQLGIRRADIERLATGALMHDIGKTQVPLSILDKPGPLTPNERVKMRRHAALGANILIRDGQFCCEVIEIALSHHEFLDGSGYPEGLRDDEISDMVRIMTIVDTCAALIDRRTYKDEFDGEQAYEMMQDMDGKLDADLLDAFRPVALSAKPSSVQVPEH
ncbi:MAG: HD-GYP domain-containing protein [Hyphomicrobiales bacterium]